MPSDLQILLQQVLEPRRAVNSGVYPVVDDSLSIQMNRFGEFESPELTAEYRGSATRLLQVSAFGGVSPREDEVARRLYSGQEHAKEHPIAGWYLDTFAGAVTDPTAREHSSSGGLGTWILTELLGTGEIDGAVHMKPSTDGRSLFSYQLSRTVQEIQDGAKTRYYPGEYSQPLREIAATPGRYAIVGIPSFIYELRLLQDVEPLFRERITHTIGLICGHQKSANYASYLAWRAGIRPEDLRDVDFRKKAAGREASDYSTHFTFEVDGARREETRRTRDLAGSDWGLGFFKTNFSDFTDDALNETADIVLGDAWLPRYTADSGGTNVVIVRDERMLKLLKLGAASGALELDSLPVEEVVRSQRALVRQSVIELPYRTRLLARRGEPAITPRRVDTDGVSLGRKLIQRARIQTSRRSHGAYLRALDAGTLDHFDTEMLWCRRRYRWSQRLEKQASRILARVKRLLRRDPIDDERSAT